MTISRYIIFPASLVPAPGYRIVNLNKYQLQALSNWWIKRPQIPALKNISEEKFASANDLYCFDLDECIIDLDAGGSIYLDGHRTDSDGTVWYLGTLWMETI